ncbi:hypothetical protein HYE59_05380 [Aggregatibacter actinomycetemcomitans]|uniref:hypothetical protein n=1 Tax=Aggregatibacter actinomycetemcomitans TaxID=714 RepID=UPI00197C4BEA|nr:hypothetical protein [Aggregatibacter actinomycetemcomitans]MBN6076980.1 hypothetical protein [Aggregatibacter actinomycetemcomitans]
MLYGYGGFCSKKVIYLLNGAIEAKLPDCIGTYVSLPAEIAEKLFYGDDKENYIIIQKFTFRNMKDTNCYLKDKFGNLVPPPCLNAEFDNISFKVFKNIGDYYAPRLNLVYETPIKFMQE